MALAIGMARRFPVALTGTVPRSRSNRRAASNRRSSCTLSKSTGPAPLEITFLPSGWSLLRPLIEVGGRRPECSIARQIYELSFAFRQT
jgi:hypothetical protein